MADSEPIVTSVTTQGDTAIVEFDDGHRVAFEGYSHGFGYQIEGLRHFFLFRGDEMVVQYDSRLYYAGPRDDEHKFVLVTEGYTLGMIVSYWEAARRYLHEEYFAKPHGEGRKGPAELWYPWKVSRESWMDLKWIKEARIPLPEPTHS